MSDAHNDSLATRLAAVEAALASSQVQLQHLDTGRRRAIRSGRLTAGALSAVAALSLLGGAMQDGASQPAAPNLVAPLTELRVQAPFDIEDDQGHKLMTLDVGRMTLYDHNGHQMLVADELHGLRLVGPEGEVRVAADRDDRGVQVFDLPENGQPLVQLGDFRNKGGEAQRGLAVSFDGSQVAGVAVNPFTGGGILVAMNADGSQQVDIKTRADGSAGVYYYKNGLLRAHMGELQRGNVAMRILGDKESRDLAGIGESVEGTGGALALRDLNGNKRVVLASGTKDGGAGSILIYDDRSSDAVAGMASTGKRALFFAGPNSSPAAELGESEVTANAGVLALTLGGSIAVQAGVRSGNGIVRVYGQGKKSNALTPGIQLPGMMP